jgi:hypothetical protein
VTDLGRPVPARAKLGVESDRHQRAHSTSCTMAMALIYTSWRYILSTPSAVSESEAHRGLATMASSWPPSWLVGEPPPWPELEWRRSPPSRSSPPRVWAHAAVAACLLVSLLHCGTTHCSAVGYRVRACACCPP